MKRWYRIVPMFMSAVLAAGNIPVTLYASQAAADVIIEETMDALTRRMRNTSLKGRRSWRMPMLPVRKKALT